MRTERVRLAALIALPVVVVAVVVVTAALVLLSQIGPVPEAGADAGLARIGNDLALVIVTDGSTSIAHLRELVIRWGLAVPLLVSVASIALAWRISGILASRISDAENAVETADEQREAHLQEAVHELRTPLAVMGTNLELAGPVSVEKAKYLDAVRRAISRMTRTIDDLDSHGRLTVGEPQGKVDLAAVARAAGLEVVTLGQERNLSIVVADKPGVVLEGIDEAAVRAAVGNFLTNAVRYAPPGSVVTIDWGTVAGWAWLSVSDDGVGIPTKLHSRVFERGWQGDHARDRNEGSGLGLTIARQMTEAQGGFVTLESEEGRGATFAAWLPLGPDAVSSDVVSGDGIHPVITPWRLIPAS